MVEVKRVGCLVEIEHVFSFSLELEKSTSMLLFLRRTKLTLIGKSMRRAKGVGVIFHGR